MKHTRPDYNFSDNDYKIDMSFNLPFEEAMKDLNLSKALTKDKYYRLSDFVKLKAFTIGRLTEINMIERAKKAYSKALSSPGLSLGSFINELEKEGLEDKVVKFEGYFNTVFRTNVMKNYNAGKAYMYEEDPPQYLEFIGIEDERQSSICSERSGIILPYSDPFWNKNWPPLHFNCRSTIREIFAGTEEAIAEDRKRGKGGTIHNEKEVIDGVTTATNTWGTKPALKNAFWNVTPSEQSKIIESMIYEEINGVARETICKDFKKPKEGFINVKTKRGGVRYPENMVGDSEFEGNLEIAKDLAEREGCFVELQLNKLEKLNPSADAWINGINECEMKYITSDNAKSFNNHINHSLTQAGTIVFKLGGRNIGNQINTLCQSLRNNCANLNARKSSLIELIVITDEKIVHIPNKLLTKWTPINSKEVKGPEAMKNELLELFGLTKQIKGSNF